VGRARELRELEAALDDALMGRGALFLIGGEPGIGKSRLANELASRAVMRGVRVLWGRCWEAGGAPAYWPWVQPIRSYVRGQERGVLASQLGSGAADVAQLMPELKDLLPELQIAVPLDPEGARFRLFDSTSTFLRNAASARPLLLVLDDLHAADVPSLLLLQFMAGTLAETHIMVVGAYRDEGIEGDHPLASALSELNRERVTRHLHLAGLDGPDSARLIEATASVTPSKALITVVHEETEGNPLFMGEVIRLLVAEGRLPALGDATPLRITIPPQVREVIERRLRRLPEDCVRILTVAAILGREFGLDVLHQTSGLSHDALLGILDDAVAARVVIEVPAVPGRMSFSHALIRDTLYDALTPGHRVQLHREIGEALERLYGDDPEPHVAELAHHFCEAATGEESEKAVDYARRAGDRAVSLLAYEEAIRLYGLGLQTLGESADDATRCELLLALGDAQARAGDTSGARATFLSAADIARRRKMPDRLARAALGYGGRFVWVRAWGDVHLVPLLQEALALLPEEDSGLRVRLLARLAGGPLRDTLPVEPRETMSQAALDMSRRLGDPVTLAYALDGRHCANLGPDVVERRLAIADELIQVSEAAGDTERAFGGHEYRMHALLEIGDLPTARQEYRTLTRLADALRQPAQLWFAAVNRAKLTLFKGGFAEAEDAIKEAIELGRPVQSANAQLAFDLQTYALRREQGRLEEIIDVVERSIDEYPAYPIWRYVLVDVLAQLEREANARIVFDELSGEGFPLYLEMQWLFGMDLASDACGYLRDAERASTLYELLLPYARHNATLPPELCRGSVARELGNLAATMSRWDVAVRHFEDALEMNSRMGARPWVAHTQHDYARMLLERDEPGDGELALDLLSRATGICRDVRMVALEGKVSALLKAGGVAVADAGSRFVAVAPESVHRADAFRRQGEYWSIRFGADAFQLRDSKGLRYLALLLGNPAREFLALDLATAGLGSGPLLQPGMRRERREPELRVSHGQTQPALDARSKAAYRGRLEELRDDQEEAERGGDLERAARAREESNFLARELAAAVGLGGRDRRAPSDAERARVNVTKAIKSAIARIGEQSPALGNHLARTVRTGTFCSYVPDPRLPATWRL
jgi:tetratricopeptide (TPR) repeat protein